MEPFEPASTPAHEVERVVEEAVADFKRRPGVYVALGIRSATELRRFIKEHAQDGKNWKNDLYTVCVYDEDEPPEGWPKLIHLSIKRNDREPIHDWRHLQEIKNMLVGPECEGVELYPAESRLTDSANQYHLYVIAEPGLKFPFGFRNRFVDDDTGMTRAKQRPGAVKV